MNADKDFVEKASRVDFDPSGQAQRRVWARLQEKPSPRRWARPLALGASALLLLAAGSWLGMRWSSYLHCPAQPQTAVSLQNAQCSKADGSYVFSTQLECDGKNCSCTKTLTICDEHPVTRVTRRQCTGHAPADFDPQDPWNLWDNHSQKDIQDLASCRNQC